MRTVSASPRLHNNQMAYLFLWLTSHFAGEGSSFLTFTKGDLIILDDTNTGETVLNSGWCVGTCERTEERGDFPAEAVYVLPCLTKPPTDILVRIAVVLD